MSTEHTWRLWKGVETSDSEDSAQEDNESSDDDYEPKKAHLTPHPTFILSDAKNNPVTQEKSSWILAIHILPLHTSVWMTNGMIAEFATKTFPRQLENGMKITFSGSPIHVEGNSKGKLFVNCKWIPETELGKLGTEILDLLSRETFVGHLVKEVFARVAPDQRGQLVKLISSKVSLLWSEAIRTNNDEQQRNIRTYQQHYQVCNFRGV